MTLTSKPLAALVVALLFGAIVFSSAMGWWQTESTKEAAVFTSGEFAGQANPADIRGSYTFGDVQKNFAVPAAVLADAFGVQTDAPSAFQVKSLEEMYAAGEAEIGTSSVRLFVAFYLGVPYDLSTSIYLPETAAARLRERSLSSEQAAYLDAHTIPDPTGEPPAGDTDGPVPQGTPQPDQAKAAEDTHTAESSDRLVKGKTTFTELLEWGLSGTQIETALGTPLPAATEMTVKDFCTERGLNFETVKLALQAEVDRLE